MGWRNVEMYEKIAPLLKNFKNLFPQRAPMEIPILDAACVSTTTTFRESQSENGAAPLVKKQNK
jgi:hypothetical protein